MKAKVILTSLLLMTVAMAALPSAQAERTEDIADPEIRVVGTPPPPGNACNGVYDEDCTCGINVKNCTEGQKCGRYVDIHYDSRPNGMCVEGKEQVS